MKKVLTVTVKIIMVLYLVCLFWAAVIHRINDVWSAASFSHYAWAFTNVIPFRTFFELMQTPGAQNVPVILHTFWLNFLALIPFGVLFCLTFPEKHAGHCAIAAAILTFFVNVSKLVFHASSFDIDDIIVGTMGAVLAFLVTKLVRSFARRLPAVS